MAFHRILVPTDFSEAAKNALLLAKDMARQGDATLTLMHVGDLPYIPTSGLTADHSQQSRFLVDLAEEMSAHQHKQLEELAGENLSDTDKVRLLVRRPRRSWTKSKRASTTWWCWAPTAAPGSSASCWVQSPNGSCAPLTCPCS